MIIPPILLIFHIIVYTLRTQVKKFVQNDGDSITQKVFKLVISSGPLTVMGLVGQGGAMECLQLLYYIRQSVQSGINYNLVLHGVSSVVFFILHRNLLTFDIKNFFIAFGQIYSGTGKRSMYHEYFELLCIFVHASKFVLSQVNE